MHMGRERGVMRWDARHWMLTDRLEHVEARLARLSIVATPDDESADAPHNPAPRMRSPKEERALRDEITRLTAERDDLRAQPRALGPSPRAKMG